MGRRIEKAEDQEHHGQVTRYTNEANQVIEERDGNDQLLATYVYFVRLPIKQTPQGTRKLSEAGKVG